MLGVLGGSGGVGASTVAATLAWVAGALLIDLDGISGGIDVLLGVEDAPGARWSGLRLGGGRLDPAVLAEALPRWADIGVLAADVAPEPAAAQQAVEVARGHGPVVVDLPRWPGPLRDAALPLCALTVLVAGARVPSVIAARAVARSVASAAPDTPIAALIRSHRASAAPARVAEVIGVPMLGAVDPPPARADGPLTPAGLPRALVRVCQDVWAGLSALTGAGSDDG